MSSSLDAYQCVLQSKLGPITTHPFLLTREFAEFFVDTTLRHTTLQARGQSITAPQGGNRVPDAIAGTHPFAPRRRIVVKNFLFRALLTGLLVVAGDSAFAQVIDHDATIKNTFGSAANDLHLTFTVPVGNVKFQKADGTAVTPSSSTATTADWST